MVNNVPSELKLCPVVLVELQEKNIKFGLGNADDMGSSFFAELFKVELSCGTKGFKGGLQGRWGQGSDNIGAGVSGVELKGIQVDKGNTRISKGSGVGW